MKANGRKAAATASGPRGVRGSAWPSAVPPTQPRAMLTALLSSEDAARVGRFQAEGCGWFIVDASPNGSRVWCSSEVCGNHERARRADTKRRTRARHQKGPRIPP
ncbi:MAG TPA: CGNR zinc finger domain-containing protein [Verrucomicrobiae bacterium]|nr:CGNR zinc finger domain-containing protein [Verrucomicrobiae bacterium]